VWAQILAVNPTNPVPSPPDLRQLRVQFKPSATVQEAKKKKRLRTLGGLGVIAASVLLVIMVNAGTLGFWAILVAIFVGISIIQGGGFKMQKAQTKRDYTAAQSRYDAVLAQLQAEANNSAFKEIKSKLGNLRGEYTNLPVVRAQKLKQLDQEQRQRQLEKYLERFLILGASIPHIGHGRASTLASWGIETARDISPAAILAVPGFGPTYTSSLLAWRASVERRFKYDPTKGTDPEDVKAIEKEMADRKLQIEHELTGGLAKLHTSAKQADLTRSSLKGQLDQAIRILLQAEVNHNAL